MKDPAATSYYEYVSEETVAKLRKFITALIINTISLIVSMFALDAPPNATPYKFSLVLSFVPSILIGTKSIRPIAIICGSLIWTKHFIQYSRAMLAEWVDPQVPAIGLLVALGMGYWFYREKSLF